VRKIRTPDYKVLIWDYFSQNLQLPKFYN